MTLSERIGKIREAKQLTQSDIAYKCNISPSAYGQIERNPNRSTMNTILRISDALGVSITFLLDTNCGDIIEKNKL
jgi:transcriptional regulator with XRE-family HTH domain